MKTDETKVIIKKLHEIYLNQDKFVTAENIQSRINYWDVYFKDFSFEIVNKAVDYWIRSHRDIPVPSDILPICKDIRFEMINPPIDFANPENIKPTHQLIWEARNGKLEDKDIPPEIVAMTDRLIESLRKDSKMRKKYEEQNHEDLSNELPYEI